MNKKALFVLPLAAALLLGGCADAPAVPSSSALAAAPAPEQHQQQNSLILSEFDSIQVQVLAADIQVQVGDEWKLEYLLSDREALKRCGVENGTLKLITKFDPMARYTENEWFVRITVPEGAVLDGLDLNTTSGDVQASSLTLGKAVLRSVSGAVALENAAADRAELFSVSGPASALDSQVENLSLESTSGALTASGSFVTLELDNDSGSCSLSGEVAKRCTVDTISGDVSADMDQLMTVDISTGGPILYNGTEAQFSLKVEGATPSLRISSLSGQVTVQAGE